MFHAQKQFHINRTEIQSFVDSVFTPEYMHLDQQQYQQLQCYQHNFTTDPECDYPYNLELNYNFPDFLLGEKLQKRTQKYIIDIQEYNLNPDEYLNRLYNRRRQGWGKSVINKAESNLPVQ